MADRPGWSSRADHEDARAYAAQLRRVTGHRPVVVLSDDPAASRKIAAFALRRPLDGRGPDGVRGRGIPLAVGSTRPASAPRSSSPRPSAGSCAPAAAARPRRCSCPRYRSCSPLPPNLKLNGTMVLRAPAEAPRKRSWPKPAPAGHPRRSPRPAHRGAACVGSLDRVLYDAASSHGHGAGFAGRRTISGCPGCSSRTRWRTCCAGARRTSSGRAPGVARHQRLPGVSAPEPRVPALLAWLLDGCAGRRIAVGPGVPGGRRRRFTPGVPGISEPMGHLAPEPPAPDQHRGRHCGRGARQPRGAGRSAQGAERPGRRLEPPDRQPHGVIHNDLRRAWRGPRCRRRPRTISARAST